MVLYKVVPGGISPPVCLKKNFLSQGRPEAGRRLRQHRPEEPSASMAKAAAQLTDVI